MLKRVAVVAVFVVLTGGLPSRCLASTFADTIAAFSAGGADLTSGWLTRPDLCGGVSMALDPSMALGSPNALYVSLGEEGSIVLGISDRFIVDQPGPDFIVWGTCNAPNEPGRILVSTDGIDFVPIGDFTEGTSQPFDLASAGLASARLVKILDLPGGAGFGIGQAFDVDALEVLHADGPVPAVENTWGRLKSAYR